MFRLRGFCFGVVLAGTYFAHTAVAQNPANISVFSGNGQLVCHGCTNHPFQYFEAMVVLVTDSQGHPVPSATVNWAILGPSAFTTSLNAVQTVTGSDGKTSNLLNVIFFSNRIAYTVAASLPNSSAAVTFTLTAGGIDSSTDYATAQVLSPSLPATVTGNAGGTGTPPVQVLIQDLTQKPIQNVSVRIIPASGYTPGASAACATGAGADPGSVLTDMNGMATCTLVLGSVTGTGSYNVLIGGVLNAVVNTPPGGSPGPLGYAQFINPVVIQVSPGSPASVKIISGNPQSATAGQPLASPLVAEVDSSTGSPISGVPVTWSVAPAGAATLSNKSSTSDSSGQVSVSVTLTSAASGTVLVTATAGSASATFAVTVTAIVTGVTKVSGGDGQTATVSTPFTNPLVVQVAGTNGQVASNVTVTFAIASGSGSLSAANVLTDSTGQARVTVTAGSTAGALTVTASVAGCPSTSSCSVTFNLTVAPPGPAITSSSFVNGAGFFQTDSVHSALTPCGIGTVIAAGIAPGIQGVVTSPMIGPLSYLLAQVAIAFGSSLAPLYSVSNVNGQQQASFQVPCDVTPSNSVTATVSVNGNSNTAQVAVRSAGPGIFQFGDSDGVFRAVIVRADGSFASVKNPIPRGETVRLYITGMGQVSPAIATNAIPTGTDSVATGTVVVAINNNGVRVVGARRAPGLIGVDEITIQVPSDGTLAPSGTDVLYVAVYPADNSGIEVSNLTWISIQ